MSPWKEMESIYALPENLNIATLKRHFDNLPNTKFYFGCGWDGDERKSEYDQGNVGTRMERRLTICKF